MHWLDRPAGMAGRALVDGCPAQDAAPAHGTIEGNMRRHVARFIRCLGGANVSASRISLGSPGLILAPPELTEAPGCCSAAECDGVASCSATAARSG
jgi:hypothetical protein